MASVEVKETVIRLMTRLAARHGAVNLAQGFTDEAPAYEMVWGAIAAMLGGTDAGIGRLEALGIEGGEGVRASLKAYLAGLQNPRDQLNQYSYPFGLPELRAAISDHTRAFHGYRPDPEEEVTVVLGASEGMASALRALCEPGDAVLVIEPFHEIYPAQARIFGLEPRFVTLREDPAAGTWQLDDDELAAALADGAVRVLLFNAPHNPTGKVFTEAELARVAEAARRHDLLVITDEIYEHMVYDGHRHRSLATLDGMRERTLVVNSISKTGRATGWRVGWVVTPPAYTRRLRAIHDNLAVQAPTPLQKGAVRLLGQDPEFFAAIAADHAAKRALLVDGLRRAGFRVTPPEGAYYLFADYRGVPGLGALGPTEAAMRLIETAGVASVPGDNFYEVGREGERYLRFAFCRGLDTLEAAVERLEAFARER